MNIYILSFKLCIRFIQSFNLKSEDLFPKFICTHTETQAHIHIWLYKNSECRSSKRSSFLKSVIHILILCMVFFSLSFFFFWLEFYLLFLVNIKLTNQRFIYSKSYHAFFNLGKCVHVCLISSTNMVNHDDKCFPGLILIFFNARILILYEFSNKENQVQNSNTKRGDLCSTLMQYVQCKSPCLGSMIPNISSNNPD